MEGQSNNNRTLLTVISIVAILALIGMVYFYLKSNKTSEALTVANTEVDSLTNVRNTLYAQVDSINQIYEVAAFQNDSLKGSLDNYKQIVAQKDNQIWRIQNSSKKDKESLKAEIATLTSAKSDLMSNVQRLTQENESLRQENIALTQKVEEVTSANTELQGQVGDLERANNLLKQRTSQLVDQAFKATAMQVDMVKANDKSTNRSKRARKVNVAFDLVDVPAEYHGAQNVYLYVTNADGVPADAGTKVKVGTGAQALVIDAQATKKVDIKSTQRLDIAYEFNEKLKEGYYIASIYADKGLLGSTVFKLN